MSIVVTRTTGSVRPVPLRQLERFTVRHLSDVPANLRPGLRKIAEGVYVHATLDVRIVVLSGS